MPTKDERYQDEADAFIEDYPERAQALAEQDPPGRFNVRRGARLVAQYWILTHHGELVADRVPDDMMDEQPEREGGGDAAGTP